MKQGSRPPGKLILVLSLLVCIWIIISQIISIPSLISVQSMHIGTRSLSFTIHPTVTNPESSCLLSSNAIFLYIIIWSTGGLLTSILVIPLTTTIFFMPDVVTNSRTITTSITIKVCLSEGFLRTIRNAILTADIGDSGKSILNPSNGIIQIKNIPVESIVEILDIGGKKIADKAIDINSDLKIGSVVHLNLPEGMYQLQIICSDRIILSEKIILQNY
jgi:hypothetical protein